MADPAGPWQWIGSRSQEALQGQGIGCGRRAPTEELKSRHPVSAAHIGAATPLVDELPLGLLLLLVHELPRDVERALEVREQFQLTRYHSRAVAPGQARDLLRRCCRFNSGSGARQAAARDAE